MYIFCSVNITSILVENNTALKNELMVYLGTDRGSVLRIKPRRNMVSCITTQIKEKSWLKKIAQFILKQSINNI